MSSLLRFLSFVPPILFLAFPVFGQLQGKLSLIPGTTTYQVSVIPTVDIVQPMSTTSSAQMVVRANAGAVTIGNIQTLTGDWEMQNQFDAPAEAPGFDYFVFFMINPLIGTDFTSGVDVPLFTFENLNACAAIELVDNTTDPFASANTLNVNAENLFVTLVAGPGGNAYEGNSTEFNVVCPGLDMQVSADLNPLNCNGDLTNITVNAIKGTQPYMVMYTNLLTGVTASEIIPTFEGSANFTNVGAGNYQITITDILDSTAQSSILISEPLPLEVDLIPGSATCPGSANGNVVVDDVNGLHGHDINAYQFFWDVDPLASNTTIDSLDTGVYEVTVVDGNGCSAVESAFVGVYNELFIQETIIDVKCFGENNGIIDITPFGVAPPYEYNWSPNANTPNNESAAWMLGPGEYHVTVTASGGVCSQVETFIVSEPSEIEVDYNLIEPTCYGDEAFLDILEINNTQGDFRFEIIGEHTAITDSLFEIAPGVPMQFTVSDDQGCNILEDFLIPNKQELRVDLGEDVEIKYGESVFIDSEVFPLSNVSLEWFPTDYLDCLDCPNPTSTPTETINYRLRLTDAEGCSVEDTKRITVRKSRDIFIPNAFSPNSDGINDIFRPYGGFEIKEIKSFLIFDRWGGLMYANESGFNINDDEKSGWDGNYEGNELAPGIYLYTMNVEFIDGEILLFSGEVNLIK